MEVTENRDGFRVAVPLPLIDGLPVSIPPGQAHLFARYGWAAALPLQWHRTSDGYIVDRSILSCGFLVAWNWWPAAAKYYASNPPSQLPEYPEFSCEPVATFKQALKNAVKCDRSLQQSITRNLNLFLSTYELALARLGFVPRAIF
jgi:hypothetical protein